MNGQKDTGEVESMIKLFSNDFEVSSTLDDPSFSKCQHFSRNGILTHVDNTVEHK